MVPVHGYFLSLRPFIERPSTYHNHVLKAPRTGLHMSCLFIIICKSTSVVREAFTYFFSGFLFALLCHCDHLHIESSSNGPAVYSSVAECFCNLCTSRIPPPAPAEHCSVGITVPASGHPALVIFILLTFNYTTSFPSSFIESLLGYSQDLSYVLWSIFQLRSNHSHDLR